MMWKAAVVVYFKVLSHQDWGAGVDQSIQRLGYRLANRGSIPGRVNDEIFLFATYSTLAQEFTQPPIQWIGGLLRRE
jgi:hypothetical protein